MENVIFLQQVLIGFVLAGVVGLVAWRLGSLAWDGALAAFVLGGLIFANTFMEPF